MRQAHPVLILRTDLQDAPRMRQDEPRMSQDEPMRRLGSVKKSFIKRLSLSGHKTFVCFFQIFVFHSESVFNVDLRARFGRRRGQEPRVEAPRPRAPRSRRTKPEDTVQSKSMKR